MRSLSNLFDKSLFNFLVSRSFFKSYNILLVFSLLLGQTKNIDFIKFQLMKLGVKFFCLNYNSFPVLNESYMDFFNYPGFVIKIDSIDIVSKFPKDLIVAACIYKRYLFNSAYFSNFAIYYNFYFFNYLFVSTLLAFVLRALYFFISNCFRLFIKFQLSILLLSKKLN